MPLLGALPQQGPLPAYAWAALAIPFLAGAVTAWYSHVDAGWREELITPAASAAVCGLGFGVLAELSGGGAGGRLAHVGPSGLLVGLALAGEMAVGALALAGGRIGWRHSRRPPEPPKELEASKPRIPKQKARADAVEENEKADEIVVVEADEVSDLPVPVDIEDLEDTQEIPVVTDSDDDEGS
jgi:hypothetical protein